MKEVQAIVETYAELERRGERAALATVIETLGSTYRRPGAHMLAAADGRTLGAISGGCLENDVLERARSVIVTGDASVVTYDSSADGDIVWGLGLGCNGVVRVLIEPVGVDTSPHPIALLAACLHSRQSGAMAVVTHAEDRTGVRLGSRLTIAPDGLAAGALGDAALTARVLSDTRAALRERRPGLRNYALPGGAVQVFVEPVHAPVQIIVCGAGYDTVPLVRLAKELGWYVTVIDGRAAYATRERFPQADAVRVARPAELPPDLLPDLLNDSSVAVVMTHHYLHDLAWLSLLLPSPVRYLGLLGPKRRSERLLQELAKERAQDGVTAAQLQRLHAPVGLDIGAETPEEVALAVLAEIQAILAGRAGGLLRERNAPIHDDPASQAGAQHADHDITNPSVCSTGK